jgi:hypothetical protein
MIPATQSLLGRSQRAEFASHSDRIRRNFRAFLLASDGLRFRLEKESGQIEIIGTPSCRKLHSWLTGMQLIVFHLCSPSELVRTGARSSETIGRYSPAAFGEEIAILADLKPVASLERYSLPG